jgi:hypothetical protein
MIHHRPQAFDDGFLPPSDFISGSAGHRQQGERPMAKIDDQTILIMDMVLEEVFKGVPHGGDHESRKDVANKLIQSARKGNVALDGLRAVGRDAVQRLSARRSA